MKELFIVETSWGVLQTDGKRTWHRCPHKRVAVWYSRKDAKKVADKYRKKFRIQDNKYSVYVRQLSEVGEDD